MDAATLHFGGSSRSVHVLLLGSALCFQPCRSRGSTLQRWVAPQNAWSVGGFRTTYRCETYVWLHYERSDWLQTHRSIGLV